MILLTHYASRHVTLSLTIATALFCAGNALSKSIPAGIVDLITGQVTPQNTEGNLEKHPWDNPNVSGLRIKTWWQYVQSGPSSYDWTGIDDSLRLASQHNKFIGLSVTAGVTTPGWVYHSGATKYVLRDGSNAEMPLPWENAFLNPWLSFVHELGRKYDGNPKLRYVVISGLGQQTETYMAKSGADEKALTILGGPTAWARAAKQVIAAYADAFPTTPFFLTLAKPFSNPDGLAALQNVTNWAAATYPGRFGIMNASLNANSSTGYYPNEAVYTYRKRQPAGFQMLDSEYTDGGKRIGGTLNQALNQGLQLGGKFVEVWEADVEDRQQQKVLATQNGALKAAAGQ
jgi:hypothetical protein